MTQHNNAEILLKNRQYSHHLKRYNADLSAAMASPTARLQVQTFYLQNSNAVLSYPSAPTRNFSLVSAEVSPIITKKFNDF